MVRRSITTTQFRSGRLLVAIASFSLFASCEWLESATVPEHLRACPRLARTYFDRGIAFAERDIATHDLDTQVTIYICGNQYMHPPLMLGEGFVAQGGTAGILSEAQIDVKGDTSLVALMESRSARIQNAAWRGYVQGKLIEMRKP
jgi:hypothetical protein